MNTRDAAGFPIAAGILFGLGLGGFFDGIVLHQVLQWHHMLTDAGYPATSVENLKINTFWDGLFHATTYVFVAMGLLVLWRTSRRRHVRWSTKLLAGTLLIGFGLFNLVEGIVDHHLLGIHHVNETVPREQWVFWDVGFLTWGAAMLIGGWLLLKVGQRETGQAADASPADHLGGRTRAGRPDKTQGQLDGLQCTGLAHPGGQPRSDQIQAARRHLVEIDQHPHQQSADRWRYVGHDGLADSR